MFSISQSKVKSWRQCRQQYHYKYVDKITKRKVRRPFAFGRLVHEMIEDHANLKNPFNRLKNIKLDGMFQEEKDMYMEMVRDVRYIMTEYFQHWPEDDLDYIRINGKDFSEHEFEIEIEKGIKAKGKIDALANAKRLRWLVEHKTFTRMPNEDQRWRNLQSGVYIRMIDIMGWKPVDGTVWDYIKSKPPSRPEILKSGLLSQRSIESLPIVVREVLKENKLREADYAEFMKLQEANKKYYFQRIFTPTNRSTVDTVFNDFVISAREIADNHDKNNHVRNIGQHCDFCDYEPLCRAFFQGSDVDFIKEREYVKEENKDAAPGHVATPSRKARVKGDKGPDVPVIRKKRNR